MPVPAQCLFWEQVLLFPAQSQKRRFQSGTRSLLGWEASSYNFRTWGRGYRDQTNTEHTAILTNICQIQSMHVKQQQEVCPGGQVSAAPCSSGDILNQLEELWHGQGRPAATWD